MNMMNQCVRIEIYVELQEVSRECEAVQLKWYSLRKKERLEIMNFTDMHYCSA